MYDTRMAASSEKAVESASLLERVAYLEAENQKMHELHNQQHQAVVDRIGTLEHILGTDRIPQAPRPY